MPVKVKTKKPHPVAATLNEQHGPIERVHDTWAPGDVAHQGDLIFVCLATLPTSAKIRGNRQLADGNTKGSRHILERGKCYNADASEVAGMIHAATKGRVTPTALYIGPVFSGGAAVRHPQHQDQVFPENTVTACVFQRNLTADGIEQRARD